MKKILIVLFALLLVGCNLVETVSPKATATTLMDSLKSMDFETAKSVADEELKTKIDELKAMADRDPASGAMIKKILGMFDYEILSEDMTDDSATVTLKIRGLSKEALQQISDDVLQAGFSVTDPSNTEEISRAVQSAIEAIDLQKLERWDREIKLNLTKDGNEWFFSQDTLKRLTDTLLP